jgi:hypothetical protein
MGSEHVMVTKLCDLDGSYTMTVQVMDKVS